MGFFTDLVPACGLCILALDVPRIKKHCYGGEAGSIVFVIGFLGWHSPI